MLDMVHFMFSFSVPSDLSQRTTGEGLSPSARIFAFESKCALKKENPFIKRSLNSKLFGEYQLWSVSIQYIPV
jgi:hypothetical protein